MPDDNICCIKREATDTSDDTWYREVLYFLSLAKASMDRKRIYKNYQDTMNPLVAVQMLIETKVKQLDESWQASH